MKVEISKRGISSSELEVHELKAIKEKEAESQKYYGIKGFLIVFIISILIGAIIMNIVGIVLFLSGKPLGYLAGFLYSSLALFGYITLYFIFVKSYLAPRLSSLFLILQLSFVILDKLLEFVFTKNMSIGSGLFSALISTSIWLSYLGSSKRVAITFSKNRAKKV